MQQGFADLSEDLGQALEHTNDAVKLCDPDEDVQGDTEALVTLCEEIIACCRNADAKAHRMLAILGG